MQMRVNRPDKGDDLLARLLQMEKMAAQVLKTRYLDQIMEPMDLIHDTYLYLSEEDRWLRAVARIEANGEPAEGKEKQKAAYLYRCLQTRTRKEVRIKKRTDQGEQGTDSQSVSDQPITERGVLKAVGDHLSDEGKFALQRNLGRITIKEYAEQKDVSLRSAQRAFQRGIEELREVFDRVSMDRYGTSVRESLSLMAHDIRAD